NVERPVIASLMAVADAWRGGRLRLRVNRRGRTNRLLRRVAKGAPRHETEDQHDHAQADKEHRPAFRGDERTDHDDDYNCHFRSPLRSSLLKAGCLRFAAPERRKLKASMTMAIGASGDVAAVVAVRRRALAVRLRAADVAPARIVVLRGRLVALR